MAEVEREKISSFELIEGVYQPKYNLISRLTPDGEITLSFNDMWKQ
jgi:hypothetical protein